MKQFVKRTWVVFVIAVVLLTTLLAGCSSKVTPTASGSGQGILLLGDKTDVNLASGLISFFEKKGVPVTTAGPDQFQEYKTRRSIVILGGPYSGGKVWDAMKQALSTEDQNYLSSPDTRIVRVKENVWAKGQEVVIYAGSSQEQTEKAWLVTMSPGKLPLPVKPVRAFALPLTAETSAAAASSGANSGPLVQVSAANDPECSLSSVGKAGSGEEDDANGEEWSMEDYFQNFIDGYVSNPLSLVQDITDFENNPLNFLENKLLGYGADNFYQISLGDNDNTDYTVNVAELGQGVNSLAQYLQLIQPNGVSVSDTSLQSELPGLVQALQSTGDLVDFLKSFSGIKEHYSKFPFGTDWWNMPCVTDGVTPDPIVLVQPMPVLLKADGSRESYTWNQNTDVITPADGWDAVASDGEVYNFARSYQGNVVHDMLYYHIYRRLTAGTNPATGSLPESGWYQQNQIIYITTPQTILGGSYTFTGNWLVDGNVMPFGNGLPLMMDGPHSVTALYQPTSKPGKIYGYTKYQNGNPISGVNITVTDASTGQTVGSAQSNQAGYYATAVLPKGGYNVSATEQGYSFSTSSVSVWGDAEADFIEQSGAYPTSMVQSQNGLEPVLPENGQGWVSLTLYHPDGTPAPNEPVSAATSSGSMSPPTTTDSKGTATFTWYAGPQPGTYQITFHADVDSYKITVPVTAGVIGINLSSAGSSLSVPPSGSGSLQVNVSFQGPWENLGRFAFYPAQLSIAGLPSGATATFTPLQVNAVLPLLSAPSSLTITVGGSVPAGNYPLVVSAVDTGPSWFNVPMSASLPLTLNVGASASSNGGITGVILNLDGNQASGNVTITQGSQTVYSTSTSNGYFNTGYTLKPGGYTVTAYIDQNPSVYYAEAVTVSASNIASVTLTPQGGLGVSVTHNGAPAPGASLSLVTPAGYTLKAVTNSQGQYSWGYSLGPGTYTLQVSYGGATTSTTVTLTSGKMTSLTITI